MLPALSPHPSPLPMGEGTSKEIDLFSASFSLPLVEYDCPYLVDAISIGQQRPAEAHRTKKAITRSFSLRVTAVSACSGVLLLESTACRSPWNSRLTFLSVLSVRRSRFSAAARRVRSRRHAQLSTSELACRCYRHRSKPGRRSTYCRSDGRLASQPLALCR